MLERETGLEISRVTLCGWVMVVGELLMPIVGAMRQELLSGDYIQADETPVDVQSQRTKGKNHQAYLWQYSRPGAAVVFDFQLDRGAHGPREFLADFDGILQTDGYAGYGKVGAKEMVHAGCWAHARRYFFQAAQLNGKDLVALGIVVEIDKLFEIEADGKSAGLGAEERLELRREKAEPRWTSIVSGVTWWVAGSTSQKTGRKFAHSRACAVAMKVNAGVTTLPFRPRASATIMSPIVALVTHIACLTPKNASRRRSSSCAKGPWLV
jgi:Transposase IS66 family